MSFDKENFKLQTLCQRLQKRVAELHMENQILIQLLMEKEPVQDYVDKILSNRSSLLPLAMIAKDYCGLDKWELCKIIYEEKLLIIKNDCYETSEESKKRGYVAKHNHDLWTQKGRLRIHEILTSRGIIAEMDKQLA